MEHWYLITGAGTGIGLACCQRLARLNERTRLILLGRRAELLKQAAAQLPGEGHVVVAADQSDKGALRETLAPILAAKSLRGVIANAGVGGANRYGDEDRWEHILQVNLSGTYYLIQECLPALLRREPGDDEYRNIVIVSSILARLGVPGYTAYCTSKAGLLGLTRSLASEYARQRLLVNAICPGWVDTDMARDGIQQFADGTGKSFAQAHDDQMGVVPTGKMSTPDEIAVVVEMLAGGSQSSFTGQALDINNGALMP